MKQVKSRYLVYVLTLYSLYSFANPLDATQTADVSLKFQIRSRENLEKMPAFLDVL